MADMTINQAANAYRNAMKSFGGVGGEDSVSLGDESKIKGPSFEQMVSDGLEGALSSIKKTESVTTQALANKAPLNELVTSITNTELTLQTVVAIRDRVISAYQDIIKMPI
jgi:flagellar hook-basal body complex protein FliE